jgi:hypothetical protein
MKAARTQHELQWQPSAANMGKELYEVVHEHNRRQRQRMNTTCALNYMNTAGTQHELQRQQSAANMRRELRERAHGHSRRAAEWWREAHDDGKDTTGVAANSCQYAERTA